MSPTLTVSTQIEIAATPAAVRSVQGWKFEPADSDKRPVDLKPGDGLKVKMNGTSMQPIVMKKISADSFQWEGSLLGLMKVRGSYLEYLTTNLYWIHHPPKATLQKATSRQLIKLTVDDVELVSSNEHHCNLKIAQTTLQDTWYNDKVKRAFYFHSSHSQVPSEALHPSTRFIDTISECLVSLDEIRSSPFKFVALSYVWGVDYQLRTTSATVEDFRRKLPGLTADDDNLRLPLTIRDAMDVTLTLGHRYLWVDALCIVQDSPSDLEIQLAQMDRIYGLAALTIVARGGKSSDSGLPGMSSPRNWLSGENITCVMNGTLNIGCWDVLDRDYEKHEEQNGVFADTTCYMWRGWTFQEQILSTRTLEFNRRRMVFWCGHPKPAVECGAAPGIDMRDAHHFRSAVRKYRETDGIVPPGQPAWNYMTKDMLISRWGTIRENYSTRHFTYPSDRRKAVLGTASMLRHVIGDIDSSGHVLSQLGTELLWYKTLHPGWNESQQPAIKFSYSAVSLGTFPSWSWLSLWPLNWPSDYKPFPAVDLHLHDAGDSSLLEIRGRTLEMSVIEEGEDGEKDEVKVYYKDGTNAKLEVYFDRSLEAQTVVTCVPIASVIHGEKSMPAWCYGMLLLQNVDESGYRRVGTAFMVEVRAGEFLRRIESDEARHHVIRTLAQLKRHLPLTVQVNAPDNAQIMDHVYICAGSDVPLVFREVDGKPHGHMMKQFRLIGQSHLEQQAWDDVAKLPSSSKLSTILY
ncbi:heterokaryon incompatibility domain-containing protein [Trichoderma pleuroticola]